jgi:NAD(P)-dependent dehydrogenase (short-subunit alcohol dehydrogenase family)
MSDAASASDFPSTGAAFVAGGSGGIGQAICALLAKNGSDVVLSYRSNKDKADQAVAAVAQHGRKASAVALDLRQDNAVRQAIDEAAHEFGGLHTAIYAAGPYIHMRHISRIEPALFRDTMEQDAFGCFNLIHAALPHLRATRGSFVALATPAIKRYAVKDVLSAAPKAAIEALVRGVAAEEGRFGIRANGVGVGVIEDGMYHALVETGDFDERFLEASRQNMALRRLGTAQEIAEAVVFLASNRARWITGQTLMVDGGYAL